MSRFDYSLWVPVAIVCAASPAQAIQYLTLEQAQRVFFPQAEAFNAAPIRLTEGLRARIPADTPFHPRSEEQPAWTASRRGAVIGYVLVDEVIGKQEFITYAVGIEPDGSVRGVEILDYRESHGSEVRDARWLAQFKGKGRESALRMDVDIQNISGATLSCRHITEGVRRLLALHAIALKK